MRGVFGQVQHCARAEVATQPFAVGDARRDHDRDAEQAAAWTTSWQPFRDAWLQIWLHGPLNDDRVIGKERRFPHKGMAGEEGFEPSIP